MDPSTIFENGIMKQINATILALLSIMLRPVASNMARATAPDRSPNAAITNTNIEKATARPFASPLYEKN